MQTAIVCRAQILIMQLHEAFCRIDKVYLSGPISATNKDGVDRNIRTMLAFCNQLEQLDVPNINPGSLTQELDRDEHMVRDFQELLGCTHILMLPGWEVSIGACVELLVAIESGLKVRYVNPDDHDVVNVSPNNVGIKRHRVINTINKLLKL